MKKFDADKHSSYFDHGVDIENRRIFLTGEIGQDNTPDVVKGLYIMSEMDVNSPIDLFINSQGGDVYHMFGLYDILNTIECPIHTFTYGLCMSSAPLLVAAGKIGERWCGKNCWFMIHDISWGGDGKQSALASDSAHVKNMKNRWSELLERHSLKTKKFWLSKMDKSGDTYFSSSEAIEWGIVDKIWDQKYGD